MSFLQRLKDGLWFFDKDMSKWTVEITQMPPVFVGDTYKNMLADIKGCLAMEEHISKEQYVREYLENMPSITAEHAANMWEHFYLIPLGKDTGKIPKGDYCYSPVKGKNKYGIPNIKSCPYRTGKEINGQEVAWCSYLELGGLLNEGCSQEGYKKLVEFFGSEEVLWDYMPLDLLFDDCKCCGVNNYTLEEKSEMYSEFEKIPKE